MVRVILDSKLFKLFTNLLQCLKLLLAEVNLVGQVIIISLDTGHWRIQKLNLKGANLDREVSPNPCLGRSQNPPTLKFLFFLGFRSLYFQDMQKACFIKFEKQYKIMGR